MATKKERAEKQYKKSYRKGLVLGAIGFGVIVILLTVPERFMGPSSELKMHNHTTIRVFEDGKEIAVPANIGIDPTLWNYHDLDQYSPLSISPIHTHDGSGIIHVESKVQRDYTLGDFMKIWGLPTEGKTVKVYRTYDQNILGKSEQGEIPDWQNYLLADKVSLRMEITSNNHAN